MSRPSKGRTGPRDHTSNVSGECFRASSFPGKRCTTFTPGKARLLRAIAHGPAAPCGKSESRFDGGKKIKGIKYHIAVDTLGLLIVVLVHGAGQHDSQSAPSLLERVARKVPSLEMVFANQGHRGTLAGLVWRVFGDSACGRA